MDLIRTNDLTKEFATLTAVSHLNWSVPEGSLCGFLGPNGAGKTTTLKMLLGMTHPTSGSAQVLGFDIQAQSLSIREKSAFVSEDKILYDNMTAGKFIRYYSSFYPDWSEKWMDEMLRVWQLPLEQKILHLSKGTRAKLWMAVSMARKPRILFLDEPTEGLDPVSQEDILELLTHWLSQGQRSAVIASHRLEEIERVCDRVAIINRGELLLNEDLEEMRSNWKTIEVMGDFSIDPHEEGILNVTRSGLVSRIVSSRFPVLKEKLKKNNLTPLHVYDMNLREIYLSAIRQGGIDYGSLEDLV
ncbi:ABC transporter ATP-binding protein [bacterium]|nr:ABC transporter ATP-binding protein [bacterium]MCI0606921.1 ABC transporter ATP-binding protein [bacterium]